MSKAYLFLENGAVFSGEALEDSLDVCGELVFSTGMVGYLENLTDPCYFGQIAVQTFPLIGNYGVISSDFEGEEIRPKAYIVRELCGEPSNFRSEGSLGAFLKSKNVPVLYGIDTRALTRTVREQGVMNAVISTNPELTDSQWAELRTYKIKDGVKSCSCQAPVEYKAEDGKFNTVVWDMGVKLSLIKKLNSLGCDVTRVPYSTTADEIVAMAPDGIVISDGPGDPAENIAVIAEIKKLFAAGIPMFGIGLGHQMIALSQGGETEKLHHGHRGSNQPVRDIRTGMVFVTEQNHGYAVKNDKFPENSVEQFVNCNDGTCEGLVYTDEPVFSVEFTPEVTAGGLNVNWLFDKFTDSMSLHMVKGGE